MKNFSKFNYRYVCEGTFAVKQHFEQHLWFRQMMLANDWKLLSFIACCKVLESSSDGIYQQIIGSMKGLSPEICSASF